MKSKILHYTLAIIVILIVCTILVLLLVRPGFAELLFSWIKKSILWLVGLAGSLVLGIKKLKNLLSGNDSISKINDSNEELKKKLDGMETKINQTDTRYNLEKQLYEKEIELLQYKLSVSEAEIQNLNKSENKLENQSDSDYYNSLSAIEKARIQKNMDDHTIQMAN